MSDSDFILYASKAYFASAWADLIEDQGGTLRGEILDLMPDEIDPAATLAAHGLLKGMLELNGVKTALELLAKCPNEGDREPTLENLGHYAAMQAMGHGVGLFDAFGSKCLKVPYTDFSMYDLEKEYSAEEFIR